MRVTEIETSKKWAKYDENGWTEGKEWSWTPKKGNGPDEMTSSNRLKTHEMSEIR